MKEHTYSIGKLAELSGVSVKALRVYEKKGLIVPVRNDENNYRIYDEDSKVRLQRIQMLQFLGFSLEQIKDFLEHYEEIGLRESFQEQKWLLEKKKAQMETMISCLERTIRECETKRPELDQLFAAMSDIRMNRRADEGVWQLNRHSNEPEGWSRWIFEQAAMENVTTILDAGAGWGNLWRYNEKRIPRNWRITCIDKHNTHADSLAEYAQKKVREGEFSSEQFSFLWDDLETMDIPGKYDRIFFNHVIRFVRHPSALYEKLKRCLNENGIFIATWGGVLLSENINRLVREFGVEDEKIGEAERNMKELVSRYEKQLETVFPNVQKCRYMLELVFTKEKEFLEFIIETCKGISPELEKRKEEFVTYLNEWMMREGKICICRDTYLYRCRKTHN